MDDLDDLDDFESGNFQGDVFGDKPPTGEIKEAKPRSSHNQLHAEWNRTRNDWSFAAIFALGYCAIFASILLALSVAWGPLPRIARGCVMASLLAAAYAIALQPRLAKTGKSNKATARTFYTIGAFALLLGLTLCGPAAPERLGGESFWTDLADSAGTVAGRWALGTFLLATLLSSRSLQFIAALATTLWMATSDSAFDPHGGLFVCIVGTYWGWRHSSRSVTMLYATLCVWTLLSEPSLWRYPATFAPIIVELSLLLFWYGASFKNAMFRGCGLVVGGIALGVAALPSYWELPLGPGHAAPSSSFEPYVLSALAALLFVIFCSHMILSGANRSAPRFILGVSLAFTWTIVCALQATQRFGVGGAAPVLCGAALAFFLLLTAEKRLLNLPKIQELAKQGSKLTTDAAEDDSEFNDIVDAETVERKGEPIGAVETAWSALAERLWDAVHRPALLSVLALHILMVLFASL